MSQKNFYKKAGFQIFLKNECPEYLLLIRCWRGSGGVALGQCPLPFEM
jgi:hypothetical protein